MKERPILFSGPMVRALLHGTKTQTRRVVKPRGRVSLFDVKEDGSALWSDSYIMDPGNADWRMRDNPYGQVGDYLWVREAWAAVGDAEDDIHACPDLRRHAYYRADAVCPEHQKWRPSIHMPRWASRLTLEITDIRVERLQDISDADAIAEGLNWVTPGMWSVDRSLPIIGDDARQVYFELWDHINGKGSCAANPWVWAVSFEVLK